MRSVAAILLSVCLAGGARAGVGSIIRSFEVTASDVYPDGIFRDATYVYVVASSSGLSYVLRTYSVAGSYVGQVYLRPEVVYSGGDHCHLGDNYLASLYNEGHELHILDKRTGWIVRSFAAAGPGGVRPENVMWDGTYYYVCGNKNLGTFRRYRADGGFAGTWAAAGWPPVFTSTGGVAFAHRARGRAGNYLVAGSGTPNEPACLININNGSFLTSWTIPYAPCRSSVYGDSSKPATYGAAYWFLFRRWVGTRPEHWVCEVDIGARGGRAVLPISLGKIKAVYR